MLKNRSKILSLLIALVMLASMLPMGAAATDYPPVSIATGEPVTINWTTDTAGSVVGVDPGSSYYPETFIIYIEGTPGISATNSATVTFLYSTSGGDAYLVDLNGSTSVITITISGTVYTLSCSAPNGSISGGTPSAVNGYLPVGQFATGTGWGAVGASGANSLSSPKLVGGYVGTGVSLGAAGGYVESSFTSPIYNLPSNPYGVDFIVYGNAFSGNPEAGSVKVYGYTGSNDTTGEWYELAGSLYYGNSTTIPNATISYKKVTTTDGTFTSTGIWYKLWKADGSVLTDWTRFTTNTAWWPEYSAESYGSVWGAVDGAAWDTTNNIITYSGVTLVKDTDTTNDYQFGYNDVHVNGSSYGVVANPYTITNTASGGDGYDLSWAVDASGNAVAVDHISKVRVYTSAAMNSSGTAMTVPAIFGETSTEVCGIYKATGTGSGSAAEPVVTLDSAGIEDLIGEGTAEVTYSDRNLKVITFSGLADSFYVDVTDGISLSVSGGTNVYINSSKSNSATVSAATSGYNEVRVISQSGTAEPFILLLRLAE